MPIWRCQDEERFRRRVLEACAMPPEEKMRKGIEMFERACRILRLMISSRNPGITENEVSRVLHEFLENKRRREDGGIYVWVESPDDIPNVSVPFV